MLSCVLGPYPLDASSMSSRALKANVPWWAKSLAITGLEQAFSPHGASCHPNTPGNLSGMLVCRATPQVCRGACALPCTTGSSGDFKGWKNHVFLSPGQKNITWETLTAVKVYWPDTNEVSTGSKDQVTEKTQPKLRASQDKHRRRGIQPGL